MNTNQLQLLLADDDDDDCLFFKEALKEALKELSVSVQLTTVHDGEQLMHLLTNMHEKLSYVLFLDLNMPRKSGFECLSELKINEKLKSIPVFILSTSFEQTTEDQLYEIGAKACFLKPADFSQLKHIIKQALSILVPQNRVLPTDKTFILNDDLKTMPQ